MRGARSRVEEKRLTSTGGAKRSVDQRPEGTREARSRVEEERLTSTRRAKRRFQKKGLEGTR